ncbi:ABC transporter ATP-binding protein [Rhodobacteraceae bacterium NNCM2]|nr:ABC transporter ATP-binding protein [Coraliihabitans acroporae]
MNDALTLAGITRTYAGARPVEVLKGVDLAIQPGEIVALVAPSGAGKSTLLQIAGLLDTPNAGSIRIAGEEMTGMDDEGRTAMRRTRLGFVYQFHHLLPEFSAEENVAIPRMTTGEGRRQAISHANELLAKVGLADRSRHRPSELSGGEQQRVAICRALANQPRVLLADEPTGNLDPETAARVFDMLMEMVRDTGLAALIATHNHDLAAKMDRVVRLQGGVVQPEG